MKKSLSLVLFAAVVFAAMPARSQSTAFTYQGRLQNNGAPVNGSYDLAFTLYTTNTGGVAVAGPVTDNATAVSNGLFTVTIDFGAGVFTGNNYWLDISISPAGSNTFVELTPRQPVLPTPYAIMANSASTAASATTAGTANTAELASNIVSGVSITGTFTGNGSGLTALNPANLSSGTAAINISGNAATATMATSATTATTAVSAITAASATTAGTANTAELASNVVSGVSITGTFSGNGGGLTNLNASKLTGSVPGASLTSVPAGSLTGTVPLAQLPSIIVTNKETGVTLSGTFSGTFSGVTNTTAASISTNGSTTGQVLTSSGGATVWANANPWLGGTPTLVTNGVLSTNAVLVGHDRAFFLGFITSTNNQQAYGSYYTIKLSQAVSTNAVIATFSPGSWGTWTNSQTFFFFNQNFQLLTTSNSITVQSISTPGNSVSYGMFVHVDQP
jgi:hypothetical protein